MSVKILHASDFHLDSPFYSLPQDKSVQRRKEQRELLDQLATAVYDSGAQIVLLAGDLFDSGASYWETSETLTRVFSQIKAHIFVSPGNHDYYTSRSPYAFMDLPDNVHIFKSPSIKSYELPDLGCRVWGAGFSSSSCEPLLHGFSVDKSDIIDIMVIHGDMYGDKYNHITADDIASSGLDYLALGHVHSFSGIQKAGDTYYAYSGCLEGRGFDETGPKGVIIGTVDKGSCQLNFAPIKGRQYKIITADLTGSSDALETASKAVGLGSPQDIARLVLTGEFAGNIDYDTLQKSFEDKFFHLTIKDESRPSRDIWDGLDEDSLTGLFLSRMKEKYQEAQSDEEREIYLMAVRYCISAIEGREGWRP